MKRNSTLTKKKKKNEDISVDSFSVGTKKGEKEEKICWEKEF
jgi:hypothetical protein